MPDKTKSQAYKTPDAFTKYLRKLGMLGNLPSMLREAVDTAGLPNDHRQPSEYYPDDKTADLTKRQLSEKALMHLGINGVQDLLTLAAGPFAPAVNMGLDAAYSYPPVYKFIDKGMEDLLRKHKWSIEDQYYGGKPVTGDFLGHMGMMMSNPHVQHVAHDVSNAELPENLQHYGGPFVDATAPRTKVLDLVQDIVNPVGLIPPNITTPLRAEFDASFGKNAQTGKRYTPKEQSNIRTRYKKDMGTLVEDILRSYGNIKP